MIVSVKDVLTKAQEGGYAVGAFNTVNLETTQAILHAASELRSPVIIQTTEKTLDYAGGRAIYHLIRDVVECYYPALPVGIHLDHGKSFELVERAVEIGFTSVMYDGSRKKYVDNAAMTKRVVDFCHGREVCVQGELGSVPYIGEASTQTIVWEEYMTDPEEACRFVEETGIDTLAIAIGNAHGFFPERPEPDYARLEKLRKCVRVPIVLHGASDWDGEKVSKVIGLGVSCFNVDTAIRLSFLSQLSQTLSAGDETDIRKALGAARRSAEAAVWKKIDSFGSEGKAEGWGKEPKGGEEKLEIKS
jgi:fructose-bisphosphate aldolase class II